MNYRETLRQCGSKITCFPTRAMPGGHSCVSFPVDVLMPMKAYTGLPFLIASESSKALLTELYFALLDQFLPKAAIASRFFASEAWCKPHHSEK